MKTKKLTILVFTMILTFVVFLPKLITVLHSLLLTFNDPNKVQEWLTSLGSWAYIALFLCVIAKVVFPMLPAKVLEIAAGYCFGFPIALILVLGANAIGTWIVRMLVKGFKQKPMLHFVDQETLDSFPLWQKEKRFAWILFLTYLIPGTPKDALTYVISLSNMKTSKLVFITTAARILTVGFGIAQGCVLEQQDYVTTIILFTVFALLSCFGLFLYRTCILKQKKSS